MINIKLNKAIIQVKDVKIEIKACVSELDQLEDLVEYVRKGNSVPIEIVFMEDNMWTTNRAVTFNTRLARILE
jgi:translation initiation factor IF-3